MKSYIDSVIELKIINPDTKNIIQIYIICKILGDSK